MTTHPATSAAFTEDSDYALADLIIEVSPGHPHAITRAILASDWLAQHDREVAARVVEEVAVAIEAERLVDDTGAREDEAYNDAISLAARTARSLAPQATAAREGSL